MKLLHILKSEPNNNIKNMIDILSEGKETSVFTLYDDQPDYGNLIDMIFEHDKVISWW
jgi:hypothetical protein